MSHTVGKRRTVIVHHPEFDKPGGQGVKAAKEFAMEFLNGYAAMIETARKNGEPEHKIQQIEDELGRYKIVIRSIDDEVMKG